MRIVKIIEYFETKVFLMIFSFVRGN